MGYRTVVMLNNDASHEWAADPQLGEKILTAMNFANSPNPDRNRFADIGNYGRVVECVHADVQTLVRMNHYVGFTPLAYTARTHGPSTDEDLVVLLKDAAFELGYRLVKKGK